MVVALWSSGILRPQCRDKFFIKGKRGVVYNIHTYEDTTAHSVSSFQNIVDSKMQKEFQKLQQKDINSLLIGLDNDQNRTGRS